MQIVHDTVDILHGRLESDTIAFPRGAKLQAVMHDIKKSGGLPRCAGAIDGTFMKIKN